MEYMLQRDWAKLEELCVCVCACMQMCGRVLGVLTKINYILAQDFQIIKKIRKLIKKYEH